MGKSSHLNNPSNYITKSRTSILVIWCSVSPVAGEPDSPPELRLAVRTHLFSLNNCIWYFSAAAIHSDLYSLQSSALLPHYSALWPGICAHSSLWQWFKQGCFVLKLARKESVPSGSKGKKQKYQSSACSSEEHSMVNDNFFFFPPVQFGWCCLCCRQPIEPAGKQGQHCSQLWVGQREGTPREMVTKCQEKQLWPLLKNMHKKTKAHF